MHTILLTGLFLAFPSSPPAQFKLSKPKLQTSLLERKLLAQQSSSFRIPTMSDSNLRSRLNIHGIVDLDQMAAILTSLVDQVDKQNKTIGELQKSLSLYVTNQTFVERVSKLESVVSDMGTRIDAIQEAATATVLNKK